ncbi:MAG: hypothetical protein KA116_02080 [Proteobacteria bacterium]|nr:hypothetical protein [Pseudomonadota bacterium]
MWRFKALFCFLWVFSSHLIHGFESKYKDRDFSTPQFSDEICRQIKNDFLAEEDPKKAALIVQNNLEFLNDFRGEIQSQINRDITITTVSIPLSLVAVWSVRLASGRAIIKEALLDKKTWREKWSAVTCFSTLKRLGYKVIIPSIASGLAFDALAIYTGRNAYELNKNLKILDQRILEIKECLKELN